MHCLHKYIAQVSLTVFFFPTPEVTYWSVSCTLCEHFWHQRRRKGGGSQLGGVETWVSLCCYWFGHNELSVWATCQWAPHQQQTNTRSVLKSAHRQIRVNTCTCFHRVVQQRSEPGFWTVFVFSRAMGVKLLEGWGFRFITPAPLHSETAKSSNLPLVQKSYNIHHACCLFHLKHTQTHTVWHNPPCSAFWDHTGPGPSLQTPFMWVFVSRAVRPLGSHFTSRFQAFITRWRIWASSSLAGR